MRTPEPAEEDASRRASRLPVRSRALPPEWPRLRLGFAVKVAAAAVAAWPIGAIAAPALTVLSSSLDRPTQHGLGVQVLIADDDNHDATVAVRYRAACEPAWRDGPPLFRVRPETVTGMTVPEQFAGSIFDLEPDTSYEIELHAVDADGPVDLTMTLNGTTRRVPPADPVNPRVRPVATLAALTAALASAQPGDVITIANGVYPAQFLAITASGTVDDPIVIRGESRSGAILDGGGCTACNLLEIYGSYVHVEQLTFRDGERALRFQGAGARNNVVRRVVIENVVHGIGSRANQLDFTLCDNVVAGRLIWPLIYSDDGGLHADDQGIRVEGDGHVVCHNRISGFGDPMINFKDGGRAYDFYGNDIVDIYGDGTEVDRAQGNARLFANRFTNVYTAVSLQPIHGGPVYVLRNFALNVADEQLKLKSTAGTIEPSGVTIAHNTFVSPGLALNLQTPITQHHFALLGNLFVGPDVTTRGYTVDWTAGINSGVFDGNGYYPDGNFWFGTVGTTRRIYPSFAAAQAAGEVEGNGVLLAPPFFATGLLPAPTFRTRQGSDLADLDSSSIALDRGLTLPGINDAFVGTAPDLGAIERGCATPIYGPRPLGMEAVTNAVNCRVWYCASREIRRNDDIRRVPPLLPAVATALSSLRVSPPYLQRVARGTPDPDGVVVSDDLRPLVLYELEGGSGALLLTKQGTDLVIDWR